MSLKDLGYDPHMENETVLIYRKILGDSEITLEINKITNDVKKFVNDFRKKIEIEPETVEIILIKNAARGID